MAGTNFSVQVNDEGRWIVDAEFSSEAEALKHAENLVTAADHSGVKVVREWTRGDGTITEREIFNKTISGRKKKITIVPVEETNDCVEDTDYYTLESRSVMGRILRKYLDEICATPMELLHNYQLIKRFLDHDIYPAAVDRIATLQATRAKTSSKVRRDEIFSAVDRLAARARQAEERKAGGGLSRVVAKTLEQDGGIQEDFLVRVAMAHDLSEIRSWIGKMQRLLQLIGESPSEGQAVLADGFIADILSTPEAIRELLGDQPNLGATIRSLVDLLLGCEAEEDNKRLGETTAVLQRLLMEGHFPSADAVIVDRVRRLVISPQKLSRNAPDQEEDTFRGVFSRLITPDGILGGPTMAEALTQRFCRNFDEGKTSGTEKAVFGMAEMLRDRAYRIRYLLMITSTDTGSTHTATIGKAILEMVNAAPDIHNFCYYRLVPLKKLTIVTDLMRRTLASALEESTKAAIVERLDKLLVIYIDREKLVDMLDDQKHHFGLRAVRLVKFCGSGVLMEGEALNVVRQRVIELLRRPRFVEEFTSMCKTREDADRTIREFRALLSNSGFSVG
ncbi:MAG: hypothetical protein ABT940_08110 [Alphaproteobacteria bacterium]